MSDRLDKTRTEGTLHLQKVGLARFNPFEDAGGDQSFALALLDNHGSGVVLSSLHGRDVTRMYSKPVREGKEAGYEFSDEEKSAISKALKI